MADNLSSDLCVVYPQVAEKTPGLKLRYFLVRGCEI
jgi:hypothetical protein